MAPKPRTLKRFHFWHMLAWLGPGAAAAVTFRNAVWLVMAMSWWTLVLESAIAWQAARTEQATTEE